MKTVGIGIDIVEIGKIREIIEKNGERFLRRTFTEAEMHYCEKRGVTKYQHYAARFAAKEAFLKALGTGWQRGTRWTDIEVINNELGMPTLNLYGKAENIADQMGVRNTVVSISHIREYAVACVLLEG